MSNTRSNAPLKSCLKSSNTALTCDSSQHSKKEVLFGEVRIMEHPLVLGDNPYCQGAPLQLDWKATNETRVDVDFYEYTRKPRRSKKRMHLDRVKREIYLLSLGYSITEIIDAGEKGLKIRKERYSSFQNKKWDRFHVIFESAKHALSHQHTVSAKTA
jgi:hypothetical protein